MTKKIILGSDHAGFRLKESIKQFLHELGVKTEDAGTGSEESVDYPDYGFAVAKRVAAGEGDGILFCGTGIGISIAANRVQGIRAAVCTSTEMATVAREHNNANIICLGGRILDDEQAKEIVRAWLDASFSPEERHHRRVRKLDSMKNR